MDVAYPVRHRRPPRELDHLIWSLRTLRHLPDVGRVFLAGGRPEGLTGIIHLPTPPASQWDSIGANLKAVVDSDISEEFVWMNDDFFFLRDLEAVDLVDRGPIARWGKKGSAGSQASSSFFAGMGAQVRILQAWGFDAETTMCTDLHAPIVLNKTRVAELIDRLDAEFPDHPVGHFRMLYGAGLSSRTITDPKIKTPDRLPPLDWDYVSTDEASFQHGLVGSYLRSRYWEPSPYESTPAVDVPTERSARMATFRNKNTGYVVTLEPGDSRYSRLSRMTHRWELIPTSPEPEAPADPVEESAEEPASDEPAGAVSLKGSAADVLDRVGDSAEVAAATLAAEMERKKPRKGLVDALTAIAFPEEG